MKDKHISAILILLYLLPFGIQCLVNNFISIYVSSLPFGSEDTVGLIAGIGAVVTMVSQLVWTGIADRSKNKSAILALSLVLLAVFSVLFFVFEITSLPLLLVLVVLFYSCYMTHQPLIDTICAEKCSSTKHSFGWFRSFASFGYGCMGLIFTFVPHGKTSDFFVYVAVLAVLSAISAKLIRSESVQANSLPNEEKEEKGNLFTPSFIKYLIFTFFLFVCSSMLSTFFPVYFTTDKGISGSVGFFSFIISAGTFLEWGIMILFGRGISRLSPRVAFALIAFSGVLRSGMIFITDNQYIMSLSVVFSGIWFGLLWSVSTPYLRSILPRGKLASAQGVWTVVASGFATFTGSFFGGIIAKQAGLKNLFLVISGILILLGISAFFLLEKGNEKKPASPCEEQK